MQSTKFELVVNAQTAQMGCPIHLKAHLLVYFYSVLRLRAFSIRRAIIERVRIRNIRERWVWRLVRLCLLGTFEGRLGSIRNRRRQRDIKEQFLLFLPNWTNNPA